MGRLDGRTAIVTGGARGMGAAHVRVLTAEGANVVLGDIDEKGARLADELGDRVRFAVLDVADEVAWQTTVDFAERAFGPVSVLINNAAVLRLGVLEDTSAAEWRHVLDVNLTGTFLGIKAVAPSMRAAGGGSIVNISSVAGLTGVAPEWAYTASKWGIRGLTKVAAMELGGHGIRVNSIHPGTIRTPMIDGLDEDVVCRSFPIARLGEPSEVAAMMLFLVCDGTYCTGAEFVADGGMLAGIRVAQ